MKMKNLFIFIFVILGAFMSYNSSANIDAHKFNFKSIDGNEIKLIDFKGKPIFVINTASLCGFTNQYKDIEELYNQYTKDGLIVLGIPSNDFGNQELSSNQEVKEFCSTNFGITFLLHLKKGCPSSPLIFVISVSKNVTPKLVEQNSFTS